jgi:hypothetical protein
VEGNTLEANPRRATGGPSKTSSDSEPGIKPLKGARGERLERTSREPQESRDRETGTDPAGGQSSERGSRHAAGRATFRRIVSETKRARTSTRDDGPGRSERTKARRDELKRGGAREPQESHRGWTRSARRPLVQTRSAMLAGPRDRHLEKRLQGASGVRESFRGDATAEQG